MKKKRIFCNPDLPVRPETRAVLSIMTYTGTCPIWFAQPTHQQQKGRRTKVCRWGWLKRNCAGIFCYALTTEKYAPFSFSILTQHKRACSYPSGTKNATTNALTGTTFVLVCNVWPQYMNLWRHLLMATFFWKNMLFSFTNKSPCLPAKPCVLYDTHFLWWSKSEPI